MSMTSHADRYIVLLLGIALIVVGFFIFIPQESRGDVFWLDLFALCFVYFVNYATIFGTFGVQFDYPQQLAGLGIRLVFVKLVSIFMVAAIFVFRYEGVIFKYQFFVQMCGVVAMVTIYFLSQFTSVSAKSISISQDNLRKGKEDILRAIHQFELLFSEDPPRWVSVRKNIEILREQVGYLSPSNNQSAIDLDTEIESEIKKAYAIASSDNAGGAEVVSCLTKCEELLKIRRNTYSN